VVAPFSESVLIKKTVLEGIISCLLASEFFPWIDHCNFLTQKKFKEHDAPIIDSSTKSALIELQNLSLLAFSFNNAKNVGDSSLPIPFCVQVTVDDIVNETNIVAFDSS
jgi:hypothetical protein